MEVQHKEEPQEVIIKMQRLLCNYGESLKAIRTWAERWNWSKDKVHRFLKLLQDMNQICYKNETVTSRVTVLNYEIYHQSNKDCETQSRRNRDAIETQSGQDKNVNNVKELKPSSNGFDEFWKNYPRKIGKQAAFKAWKRLKFPQSLLPIILSAIEKQKTSTQWKRDNGQFIPHPTTWLNQGRWDDEIKNNIPRKEYVK